MSYSKHETVKKQRKLVSKTQRNTRKILVRFILDSLTIYGGVTVIIIQKPFLKQMELEVLI